MLAEEAIKPCVVEMACLILQMLLPQVALSDNTVRRRIDDICDESVVRGGLRWNLVWYCSG